MKEINTPETEGERIEFYFDELKKDFMKIHDSIEKLEKTEPETAKKFKEAFISAVRSMLEFAERL